jgi:hypothetical protein
MAQGLNHIPIINKPNKKIIKTNIKWEQKREPKRELWREIIKETGARSFLNFNYLSI